MPRADAESQEDAACVLRCTALDPRPTPSARNILVVARAHDARTGKVKPVLLVVPPDAEGFEATAIPMEIVSPEKQSQVFLDEVRLPADAVVATRTAGSSSSSPG